MIIDQSNGTIHQAHLLDIHFNGVFIGVLKTADQRINLFYWNRFMVEIHCQFIHQQWEPVSVNYLLRTEAYMDSLMSGLTNRQFCKLQDAVCSQEMN